MAKKIDNRTVLAENLKHLISQKGITRRQLSSDLGISYTTVSDWINAKNYPRIERLEQLTKYFNVSKSELIEEPQEQANANVQAIAAHVDHEMSASERQQVINFIENLKKARGN
ncbi:MAG: helix-turn-helix domain-containing protein [Lentilactobacillus buchneri]|jgi:transcriptional regulator with XRE-family HTH domain|nr:helix-turn-helix domain-containing protein [Lentilactobacillus buchneri]